MFDFVQPQWIEYSIVSIIVFVVFFTIVNFLQWGLDKVFNKPSDPVQWQYREYTRSIQAMLVSEHKMQVDLDVLHQYPYGPYICYCVFQGIDAGKCANYIADKIKNNTLIS